MDISEFLTIPESVEKIKVSRQTIYNWMNAKHFCLPYIQRGGTRLINPLILKEINEYHQKDKRGVRGKRKRKNNT